MSRVLEDKLPATEGLRHAAAHHQLRHRNARFYPSPLVSVHYVNEVPRCRMGAVPCRRPPAR